MKKVILVDGNNLLFRSYYATAYTGNVMRNSKGFPTNALYGFINMMNKIVDEEKPLYCAVAFDKGKTFRHEKYDFYKDGRIETPDDLKKQFPIAKQIIEYLGLNFLEIDNYEADDIIGTLAKEVDINDEFISTIVSSDKDLLQLISNDNTVKLLKSKDYIYMDEKTFIDTYGITPIHMIDLKALMGDPSDNIPGVKGIGEKTALNLLKEYGDINNLYSNIENIKGKLKDKLIEGKDSCFTSYEIATIYKEVPLNLNLDDIKIKEVEIDKIKDIYEELEFYSFLKKLNMQKTEKKAENKNELKIINNINDVKIEENSALYLELDNSNYHTANILGMGIYNSKTNYYIPFEVFKDNYNFLNNNKFYTYDIKKVITSLKYNNIEISSLVFDTMISAYLLGYNVKDDISYLASSKGYNIEEEKTYRKNKELDINNLANIVSSKCKFIYDTYDYFNSSMKNEEVESLYNNIEIPLTYVLSDMEYNGIKVDLDILEKQGEVIYNKITELEKVIYTLAGEEFNIASPKQLGDILFEKLALPHGKKTKTGYSTDISVLNKLQGKHLIVDKIIEYRTLTKLYFTYIVGLKSAICDDGKIHTIYTQTLTRTGRLSSIEPNLQNIPVREEEGRLIRKCFIPSDDSVFISSDYSQVELRVMAHLSNCSEMINAFNNNIDIHTSTASHIFNKDIKEINKNERRIAKAVNFGIIYGISAFGLSENAHIPVYESKNFIEEYLSKFHEVKDYMDKVVNDAYSNGYVTTLTGRKRVIDELNNTNATIRNMGERIALNTPIQGLAADILKIAMINLYNEFNKREIKSKILLQVHDELIIETKKEELNLVKDIVKEVMESAYKLNVALEVDINEGNNWYEAK